MIRVLGLGLFAAACVTDAARAQALPEPLSTVRPLPIPAALSAPRLNLKPVASVALRYAQAPAPLPRGVARTSVEHSEGGVTGSAGLLCGLQPSADRSGVGSARGYNTQGRFIGGKLAFSF